MPSTPSDPRGLHGLSVPHQDWERTPVSVRTLVSRQHETITKLLQRVEEPEARIGRNSKNSNPPPSSIAPHQRVKRKKSKDKKKPGVKKAPQGHQQALLEPTETVPVPPTACSCGCREFVALRTFHTHQPIELPEITMVVTHFFGKENVPPAGPHSKPRYRRAQRPDTARVSQLLSGSSEGGFYGIDGLLGPDPGL